MFGRDQLFSLKLYSSGFLVPVEGGATSTRAMFTTALRFEDYRGEEEW